MDLETLTPKYYTLKEFEFINGIVLKNQIVEYTTFGTPLYDNKGYICNAIVYFHGTDGNYGSVKRIQEVVGKKLPFNTDKFFFVSLSTLGSPGSSSPSITGLDLKYPVYGILDMVNFNKCFLKECLNIIHPKGLIGNSMGGFEAITWAAVYPNDIDFLISLVSSYKTGGQNYVLSKFMNDMIESDPLFNLKDAKNDFNRSLMMSSKAMYSFGLSKEYYMDLDVVDIDNDMDKFAMEDANQNIYDVYYRNKASITYDLTSIVGNIIVPTLIIGIYEDQYFPPELDAIPMSTLIADSTLVCYNSYKGHIGSSELNKIYEELDNFLYDFK